MTQAADPLVLDFIEWVAREPRSHAEVVATWKTSCPRLTIWEDAAELGYVTRAMIADVGAAIVVTPAGTQLLRDNGRVVG